MTILEDLAAELYKQIQKVDYSELEDELGFFTPPKYLDLEAFTRWVGQHTQSAIYWNYTLKHKHNGC